VLTAPLPSARGAPAVAPEVSPRAVNCTQIPFYARVTDLTAKGAIEGRKLPKVAY